MGLNLFVVVVDDSPSNLAFLDQLLVEMGCRVLTFMRGDFALDAAVSAPPDLFLIDAEMQEMLNFEMWDRLKRQHALRDVPILLIGSHEDARADFGDRPIAPEDFIAAPPQAPEIRARIRKLQRSRMPQRAPSDGSRRILVVDDEEGIRSFFQRVLSGAGYQVETLGDGVQALRRIREAHFDLAIVDLIMPGKEGMELLTDIRREQGDLPVIVISGGTHSNSVDVWKMARMLGANATIQKPVMADALIEAVEKTIGAGVEAG